MCFTHSGDDGDYVAAGIRKMKQPCVYILASQQNGTLYIGVTSDLKKRVWQHKNEQIEGFTRKYGCKFLVWYKVHETMEDAIHREKRLKKYKREAKIRLIESLNKGWRDLYEDICK